MMVSPRGKCEKFRQFVKTDAQPFPIIFSHISFSMIKEGGKDDDLYGAVINRYCILQAECLEFEQKRELMYQQMAELEMDRSKFLESNEISSYYKLQTGMQKNLISLDRQVQAKRKMLMDIEKENIMTIASSLRTIPKKPEKKRNALREALEGGC